MSKSAGSLKKRKGGNHSCKRSEKEEEPRLQRMYAVVTTDLGAADVLRLRLVLKPKPKANEVLVKVAYAGVNRPDIHQRTTMLPPDGTRSEYLGLECSGHISEFGVGMSAEDKNSWKLGDAVCAITNGGSYAEYVAVPVANLLPIPCRLKEAATFPQAACTVWSELFMKERLSEGAKASDEGPGPRLSSGDTLLIHGGSSGIGTFAIQMAKQQGVSTVYVTAGSDEKLKACKDLGADVCINYRKDDFEKVIRRETAGKGVNVILDGLGQQYLVENYSCLSSGGKLVTIGPCCNMAGQDSYKFYSGRHMVTACALRNRTAESKAAIVKEVRSHVWPAIEAGQVKAYDNKILPFAFKNAADAHKRMEKGDFTGKILLYPGPLP